MNQLKIPNFSQSLDCKMEVGCKVAIVNGGISGIGLAAASQLLCAGARNVAVTGDDLSAGKSAEKFLNDTYGSGKAMFIHCNINCTSQFEGTFFYSTYKEINDNLSDAFRIAHGVYKKLDIVVNTAGIVDGAHWEREIVTNIIGTIRGTLLAYHYVGRQGVGKGGVVINVAGINGVDPLPPAPTLSAAQHAIVGLSKSFGSEIHTGKSGVRVVCFCPGFTSTNFMKNPSNKAMTDILGKELESFINNAKKQGPDPCGHSIVHLIKYGENGSVWVCEGAKLFSLQIPHRKCYSTLIAQYL
ncbi:hypothetical protein RI129_008295 [Pyrocoelia pectoralis]|uniref:Uncharacterized protein n=1 Tax=Pyrocoelia pectoralis TaxID=417401 RepID=A0AAN7ZK35_9COLE